jgi:hypothetical protein
MQSAPSGKLRQDLRVSIFPFDSDRENRRANPALVSVHGATASVNILQCHCVANVSIGGLNKS